jgi:hypothetical protein
MIFTFASERVDNCKEEPWEAAISFMALIIETEYVTFK